MGGKRPCNSFVKIRHGDDESSLFNPDCAMKLLVDSIRKTCNCPSRELAVAEESLECHDEAGAGIGEVTELSENMENGRVYFTDRGTYVLLALQRKEDRLEYEALLDDEHLSLALKDKLHALNNPKAELRRPTRVSKSKPGSRNTSRKTSVATRAGKK